MELVVLVCETEFGADEALLDLRRRGPELLDPGDAAVVARDRYGRVTVRQSRDLAACARAEGLGTEDIWGRLFGALFLSPAVGWGAGTLAPEVAGAAREAVRAAGLGDEVVRALGASLRPGRSALFIRVREAPAPGLAEALEARPEPRLRTPLGADAGGEPGRRPEPRGPRAGAGGVACGERRGPGARGSPKGLDRPGPRAVPQERSSREHRDAAPDRGGEERGGPARIHLHARAKGVYTRTVRPGDGELGRCAEIRTSCACAHLRRAARAVTQLYDEVLRPSGLRATQFTLLVALERSGAPPMTRLAEAVGMDRTTLTRNLRPLVRRGLARTRPGRDSRVREVELTDRGRAALSEAIPLWERAQGRVAAALGRPRMRRLLRDLDEAAGVASSGGGGRAAARAPRGRRDGGS